jgi:hypothetical protein
MGFYCRDCGKDVDEKQSDQTMSDTLNTRAVIQAAVEGGAMSDVQINIAIAEACGWLLVKTCDGSLIGKLKNEQGPMDEIPDYCNDLNAMHEAEKILSDESHADYACELVKTIRQNGEWFESVSATAAQRAEAFLKTINKWEGGSDE